MKVIPKNQKEVAQISSLIESKASKLLRHILTFDTEKRSFIELELYLCEELNKLGARVLEQSIPLLYGDGYQGSRVDIDEETSYRCVNRNRERTLLTAFGRIKIARTVYTEYYSGGSKSFLDEKLYIEDKKHCPLITYWTDLLGTVAPFNEAADILNKIRGIKVSTKQVEISTEHIAKKITDHHDEHIKNVILDEKGRVPPVKIHLNPDAKRTVYIETDGCQINTDNGWKECKTFMLFETEKTAEDEYRLTNKFYYSTMREVGELRRQLKYHLERYCGDDEVNIVVIGDGAKWIWNTIQELFPEEKYPAKPTQIVDFYHAIEKIGDIKEEIYNNKESGNRFFKECKEHLKAGNIEVIEQLLMKLKSEQKTQDKKEFVDNKLKYLTKNKEKMRYAKYKEQGFCIGSGAIESANKYVIQRRVKLQGMRWKEENANYMAHLRAEYINKEMDKHYNIRNNPLLNNIAVT